MKIVNCVSLGEMCEAALDGEPIFLLRAKDNLALDIVEEYYNRADVNKATNLSRVRNVINKMSEWRKANPNKCKNPD